MNETRVEHKLNEDESISRMLAMVENYDPKQETMVVIKVSGSLFSSNTSIGSNVDSEHLVGLLRTLDVFGEQCLKRVEEKNPLTAALIVSLVEEQKNS
ncbi:hypothetical protein LMF32_01050 [Desemzia sp. C1]|uniref:hypothetical protein n=1 Tax=Desemzia sp. C1 TaxID=2892016 RepID=UPI001E580C3A|nr:hypothetical protein [Desemzia sp. C1]MCI3027724.1 hypothetical protein [Desemzia sp. C1]